MGGISATEDEYNGLARALLNTSGAVPLAQRFRALFALRSLGTHRAIAIIGRDSSALLGHELAYCLGQIGDPHALPILEAVLADKAQHPMVRHEAAEAMGAISCPESLPTLRHYLDDDNVSVRETCQIALAKIEYDHGLASSERTQRSRYDSIDPAPPLAMHSTNTTSVSVPQLRGRLLDSSASLFERYRAMFALRNLADSDDAAVLALADGFSDNSALFRHEIAYIFGQLSSPASVPALLRVLDDTAEDEMVRHEAAEALGSLPEQSGVEDALRLWAKRPDSPRVVRESCEVALDMLDAERAESFTSAQDSVRELAAVA